ncbi:hypothetical protein GCM10025866_20480 [Naasia aerilata]|uniref:Alpha-xylosidase n=1 Tax=Naasia aerilata TaxID=1162966 RepID=A0ABM8GCZ1_9MICO|nr:hypothetical protein GCM10025866_20480 [Naasia aerilata]
MKFTDGFWQLRDGVTALYASEAYEFRHIGNRLQVLAPTKEITTRGTLSTGPL